MNRSATTASRQGQLSFDTPATDALPARASAASPAHGALPASDASPAAASAPAGARRVAVKDGVASKPVTIYADGACKGNPGPGGWGALLVDADGERELFGGEAQTTNNRMELLAVIRALEAVPDGATVALYTDSRYVQQGMTSWIHGWKRKGWRTADGKPVKNVDLWQVLDGAAARHRVQWHWVRGHDGHAGNERADALANRGVREAGLARK